MRRRPATAVVLASRSFAWLANAGFTVAGPLRILTGFLRRRRLESCHMPIGHEAAAEPNLESARGPLSQATFT